MRLALSLALCFALPGCPRSRRLSATQDAGPEGGPDAGDGQVAQPVFDAGHGPTIPRPAQDAAALDGEAQADAGPLLDGEAPADAGPLPDAEAGADAEAHGFLVYSLYDGDAGANAVYALRTDDFSTRRLDPTPATQSHGGTPLAYSPDGRWLVVKEIDDGARTVFWLVSRCRDGACTPPAGTRFQLTTLPRDLQQLKVSFAPDSRAVLIESRAGARYVRVADAGPEPAVEVGERSLRFTSFLQTSRALLVDDGLAVWLWDFEQPAGSQRLGPLPGSAMGRHQVSSVSPDGQHWLTHGTTGPRAFDLAAVLAGDLQGRVLGGQGDEAHAGEGLVAVRTDAGVTLHGWQEAAPPLPLGAGIDGLRGCGNHALLIDGASAKLVSLAPHAGSDPPPLIDLGEPPLDFVQFVGDCAALRFAGPWGLPSYEGELVYLDDQHRVDITDRIWPSNHEATLLHGPQGLGEVVRVDTLGQSSPQRYVPRTALPQLDPVYVPGTLAFLAAAPLRDVMEQRIFRVDFDTPGAPLADPLTPEGVEPGAELVLSPDQRYVAYGVDLPVLPVELAQAAPGVFELDLQTGAIERVTPAVERRSTGTLGWLPVPGRDAILLLGDYAGQPRTTLLLADLRTGARVKQLPEETPPRTLLPLDELGQHVTPEGTLWYRAITESGPGRFAQPLRLTADAPLEDAQVLAFDDPSIPRATDRYETTLGVLRGLGPIYRRRGGQGEDYSRLHYFDLAAGEERLLAEDAQADALTVAAVGTETGRVALYHHTEGQPSRLTLLLAGTGEPEVTVHSADRFEFLELSPDERWLTFIVFSTTGSASRRHVYDIETGSHWDYAASRFRPVRFHPDGTRMLYANRGYEVRMLDLTELSAAPVALADVDWYASWSESWQWVAWDSSDDDVLVERRTDTGALVERFVLEVGEPCRPLLSPGGDWLLVLSYNDELWRAFPTAELATLDYADGVLLPDSHHADPSFSPDGRLVAMRNQTKLVVWSLQDLQEPAFVTEGGRPHHERWLVNRSASP